MLRNFIGSCSRCIEPAESYISAVDALVIASWAAESIKTRQ